MSRSTRWYKYELAGYPSVIDFYNRGEDPEAPPVPPGARVVSGGLDQPGVPQRSNLQDLIRKITGQYAEEDEGPIARGDGGEVEPPEEPIQDPDNPEQTPTTTTEKPTFPSLFDMSPETMLILGGVGVGILLLVFFAGKKR